MEPRSPSVRPQHRRHGTVMLVVVVVLALVAVMGLSYLQYARIQRFANPSGGDIDTVIDAAVTQIRTTMASKLRQGSGFAPYDYPWTNSATTWSVAKLNGTKVNAVGNDRDNTWLASSSPEFTNNTWPHVTN